MRDDWDDVKQKSPKGLLKLILWHFFFSHTSILFSVTCYQFWKLWTKKTPVRRTRSYKVESLPDTSLSFTNTLSLHKQARRVNKWLAYHWQNDGRLHKFADKLCWRIVYSQMSFYIVFFKKYFLDSSKKDWKTWAWIDQIFLILRFTFQLIKWIVCKKWQRNSEKSQLSRYPRKVTF